MSVSRLSCLWCRYVLHARTPTPASSLTHYHPHRPRAHHHCRLRGEYQPHTYFKAGAISTSVWKELLGDCTGVRGVRTRVGTLARCGSRLPHLYAHARTHARTHTHTHTHAPISFPATRLTPTLLPRQCVGGTHVFYPGLDTSALPQDLYRVRTPSSSSSIVCSPSSHPHAPYRAHASSFLAVNPNRSQS